MIADDNSYYASNKQKLPALTDSIDFFKWKANAVNILMQKGPGVYDAVMLDEPAPEVGTDAHYIWQRSNLIAKGLLLASMSIEISTTVDHYETAREIWTHVIKSFTTKLKHRLEEIKTSFNSVRQDKSTIAQFAAKIATMVEQLKLGGTNITWAKRRTVLMKGLCPEYASICGQLDIA